MMLREERRGFEPLHFRREFAWPNSLWLALVIAVATIVPPLLVVLLPLTTEAECIRYMFPWSPAIHEIDYSWIMYEDVAFEIDSVYVGKPIPNQTNDLAWADLIPPHAITIPEHKLANGLAERLRAARRTARSNNVAAVPEVFVQLSCLNLLRQYAFGRDYDVADVPSLQGSNATVLGRVDECLQRLRVAFMCWSDTTPILKPIDSNGTIVSNGDLRTLHYCRDFERILRWTEQNGQADVEIVS